jgi:hypothetical protein
LGAGDDQWPFTASELGVEQEEGQASEVIAVKVRDQDDVDALASDAEALQRQQR